MTKYRGNCQMCGRLQAIVRSRVAKHGYSVKDGYFKGVCHGHTQEPVQRDRSFLDKVVSNIQADITLCLGSIDALKSGKKTPKYAKTGKKTRDAKGRSVPVLVLFEDSEPVYQERAIAEEIYENEFKIRSGKSYINMLLNVGEKYHGKPLVEVVEVVESAPLEMIEVGEKRIDKGQTIEVISVIGQKVNCKLDTGSHYVFAYTTQDFQKLIKCEG